MNCPVCNAPNVDGAAFCDNCGTKLVGQPAPSPLGIQQAAPVSTAGGTVCPLCQSRVIPGTAFCDVCGAALASTPPMPVVPSPGTPVPPLGGEVRCASCGASNLAGQVFCDNCGQPLGGARSAGMFGQGAAPLIPAAPAGPRVSLTVAASGVAIDLTGKTKIIIGRADPVSGVNPEVDLTPHGGDEGGVSRRHAELSFDGFQWQIKDLDSTNGSAVNNQRLSAHVPQPLNSGDQIRLGKLVLVFQAG